MTLLHDLAALADKAARITQSATPCLTRQRLEIAAAAYEGNAEQQAAMKAARHTGDAELIAIEVGLAQARAQAALQAFDLVFGGVGEADAQKASSGDIFSGEAI